MRDLGDRQRISAIFLDQPNLCLGSETKSAYLLPFIGYESHKFRRRRLFETGRREEVSDGVIHTVKG